MQIQTAFKQDHRDGEVDDPKQPAAECFGVDPTENLRAEQRPERQEQDDPRHTQVFPDRLSENACSERHGQREACMSGIHQGVTFEGFGFPDQNVNVDTIMSA